MSSSRVNQCKSGMGSLRSLEFFSLHGVLQAGNFRNPRYHAHPSPAPSMARYLRQRLLLYISAHEYDPAFFEYSGLGPVRVDDLYCLTFVLLKKITGNIFRRCLVLFVRRVSSEHRMPRRIQHLHDKRRAASSEAGNNQIFEWWRHLGPPLLTMAVKGVMVRSSICGPSRRSGAGCSVLETTPSSHCNRRIHPSARNRRGFQGAGTCHQK